LRSDSVKLIDCDFDRAESIAVVMSRVVT
jgi:hypothetical protein